jgi:hypothetical protein
MVDFDFERDEDCWKTNNGECGDKFSRAIDILN